jgi:hypothetical protein
MNLTPYLGLADPLHEVVASHRTENPLMSIPAIKTYAAELADTARHMDRPYESDNENWHVVQCLKEAAQQMQSENHAGLVSVLSSAYDNYTRELILEYIHPAHWAALGVKAIDLNRSIREFEQNHVGRTT